MQQIIPSYKSIGELLSGNKFTIDEYQREYKWEKENISDLINDLLNKFRSLYKSDHSIREVSNYEDYFLGSIILNKKNLENRDVYSIVDGQQRITSITLLLIYLYHVATTKNLGEAIRAKIQGMIYSDSWGNNSYNLDISDRYLVLDSLFKGKDFNFEIHNESVRNMYERYQDIDSENLEKELDTAFEHFLYWVCNRVKVIEISCQSSNQAYDIFETMNDRGKPLSPVDMLKSFFLSHVISDNNKLTHLNAVWRSEIYKINTWNDIYYGDREIRFFKIWFRAKYATNHDEISGKNNNKDLERINNSPNRWARENAQRLKWDTENVIISLIEDEFKHFSHIYTLILKRSSRFDPVFDIIHYNYIADFSWQVTILLSSIRLDDDDNEVSRKMRILSKYIDFWLVSRFANGKRVQASDNQELFELTIDIRNMDFDTLKDYLIKKVDNSELHILGGKKGKKGGIRELSLNNYTKKGIKYILARISEFIERGSTEEDTTWLSWFMHKADIEHIVEDNYERYTADYYSKADFKSYRNKIGALILLESGKNKSLKDSPFSYKKNFYLRGLFARSLCEKAYIHETGFRNFITKNGFDFKPYEKFGIEEIDERTDLVAKIAEYIWNRDRIIEIE